MGVMEGMEDMDTEDTMERDMLMLSQDTLDMEVMALVMDMVVMLLVMEVMVLVMDTMVRDLLMLSQVIMFMVDMDMEDTEDMEDMDTEVTMARDLLMLSQDIMVMEDMDMVADTTDKKLVHTIQFKAINHKFYFKTDSFSQLSKLLNKRIFFW